MAADISTNTKAATTNIYSNKSPTLVNFLPSFSQANKMLFISVTNRAVKHAILVINWHKQTKEHLMMKYTAIR